MIQHGTMTFEDTRYNSCNEICIGISRVEVKSSSSFKLARLSSTSTRPRLRYIKPYLINQIRCWIFGDKIGLRRLCRHLRHLRHLRCLCCIRAYTEHIKRQLSFEGFVGHFNVENCMPQAKTMTTLTKATAGHVTNARSVD